MTSSKTVFKRARPLMGTTVEIEVTGASQQTISDCFYEIEKYEKIFSFHDTGSLLSEYNRTKAIRNHDKLDQGFAELRELAELFTQISDGGFFPYRENDKLDLSGIAKGYIVDKAVEYLSLQSPECGGCINAGGDLRFFNSKDRKVFLRLGNFDQPLMRPIELQKNSIATSSIDTSLRNPLSSTRYHLPLRDRLQTNSSVSVQADHLVTADALTKIVLFSNEKIIQKCCDFFKASAFVFDENGNLIQGFGS